MNATMQSMTESDFHKIVDASLNIACRRANSMTPYADFTTGDIASMLVSEPSGDGAYYVAQLISWGIEWFLNFRNIPELLDAWGKPAALESMVRGKS